MSAAIPAFAEMHADRQTVYQGTLHFNAEITRLRWHRRGRITL